MRHSKRHLVIIWTAFLTVLFAHQCVVAIAQGVIEWPQVKRTYTPAVNQDGNYVALRAGYSIQVWEILPDGKLSKVVWDSREEFANSITYGFAWAGRHLIFSKIDGPQSSKKVDDLSDQELYYLEKSRGATYRLNPESGQVSKLDLASYRVLSVDPSSKFLAAATPTDQPFKTANIVFFDLSTSQVIKQIKVESSEAFRDDFPYIIGWDAGGEGIYAVTSNDADMTSRRYRRLLLYIDRSGTVKNLLPEKASVMPDTGNTPPRPTLLDEGGVSLFAIYLDQAIVKVTTSPSGTRDELSWKAITDLLWAGFSTARILSMSPNGRFLLLQDTGAEGIVKPGSEADVWIVDLHAKKRRKVARVPNIGYVYQWSGAGLLVGFETEPDYYGRSYGLIRCPEATSFPTM